MPKKHSKSAEVSVAVPSTVFAPVVIRGAEDMTNAVEVLSRLNTYLDRVTEEREKVTKPLNEALRAERARFKPIETKLSEAILAVRTEMSRYQTKLLVAEKLEREKIARQVATGKLDISKAVAALASNERAVSEVVSSSGSVKFRVDKVADVVDKKKVPLEYMEVDLKRVKEALLAGVSVGGCVLKDVQVVVNKRA